MESERFRETLNDKGEEMLERLVKMKKSAGGVGYSLQN